MKRRNFVYLLILISMPAFMLSCKDDFAIEQSSRNIKEGIPVTIPLSVAVEGSKQISRAAQSDIAEKTINYLYVAAFNSDGTLDNNAYFEKNEATGSGEFQFGMTTGLDKRIYAIANPLSGSGSLTVNYLNGLKTESEFLNAVSHLRTPLLITRSYFLMSGKMEPDSPTGKIDVDVNDSDPSKGVIIGTANPKIYLQRVDARITFKVKGENSKYSDFKFVADRYWVGSIPQGTFVFPKEQDYVKTEGQAYASMTYDDAIPFEGENAEGYNMFEFYLPENRQEPKKRIETANQGEAENLYALREKREKTEISANPNKPGQTHENGEFIYANPNSTFVMFHGVLSYTDNTNLGAPEFVSADVTYTVHLGNTGGEEYANTPGDMSNPNEVCVNNYRTERNTHYTYTVTVTGINSLIVEVDQNNEVRPGMEGDVIIAGAKIASMDSHYGRASFSLKRGDIKNGLSWAVSTHFQRGMKVFVADDHKDDAGNITEDLPAEKLRKLQTDISLNDYKWVHFAINKEAIKKGVPVQENQYVKYPGYQSYTTSNQTESAPAFNKTTYSGGYYDNPVTLYDVNQLINHLYVEANKTNSELFVKNGKVSQDDDAVVTFTAFVDEYVYKYDPTKVFYEIPENVTDASQLQLWKEVVNGEDRMLHFCTSGNIYSADGATSLSRSVITISQKPIYSFYNTRSDITTAWGTESIRETGRLLVSGASMSDNHDNTKNNGRENTLNIVKSGLKWTDVLEVSTTAERELKDGYNNIWYACLLRNRDLNGNNIIEENEIRWYLASVDQLTDLWIGQGSLNKTAWLYQDDGTVRRHVASSSYYNSTNKSENPWVIWGEEGASRGSKDYSDDYNGTSSDRNYYDYRCVRNLGLKLGNISEVPQDYVKVSTNTYNNNSQRFDEYILDLSRMDNNSLRGAAYIGAELPEHFERGGEVNKPYKKLAVLRGVSGTVDMNILYPSDNHDWHYYQGRTVCPKGYRTPNQRELMLLYTTLNSENPDNYTMDWGGTYFTNTGFSFNGNSLFPEETKTWGRRDQYSATSPVRPGFLYTEGNLILETSYIINESNYSDNWWLEGKYKGKVRCVRDIVE